MVERRRAQPFDVLTPKVGYNMIAICAYDALAPLTPLDPTHIESTVSDL